MLIFRNPGLIDLDAVRTLGVSVKLPGSFGRFGTGLKFAIATILRGGGQVTLYRGLDRHEFGTRKTTIRDHEFDLVTLDGLDMGVTTMLGRDWEPWMVLRELGCNALDEGGEFGDLKEATLADLHTDPPIVREDQTTIVVDWADLDTAYQQRDQLFLPAMPTALLTTAALAVFPGPAAHLFYRGVRVMKLPKPALFTYNILAEQHLTEDRTLLGTWGVDGLIRDCWFQCADKELVRQALTAGSGYHEATLDFAPSYPPAKPSRAWLDAAIEAREGGEQSRASLNESAKKTLAKYLRDSAETDSDHGSYRRVVDDAFEYAKEQLADIGIQFAPDQTFIMVDELPGEARSLAESGRVYILNTLLEAPAREVATELLARWVDLATPAVYDVEGAVRLLAPFVLGHAPNLDFDEQLVAEDAELERMAADEETETADRASEQERQTDEAVSAMQEVADNG